MKKIFHAFAISVMVLFFKTKGNGQKQSAKQPNIIFILADDLGYGDIGAYGQTKIKTPNIDLLAKEGMKFTDFYAGAPVCSPSRCVLITGKNMGHSTIRGNSTITGGKFGLKGKDTVYRANILPNEPTIGNVLQQAGYTTAVIGKWHIDGYDTTATPLRHGFDYFVGWLVSYPETYASTYWSDKLYNNGKIVSVPQNENGKKGYYASELYTDEAIYFMDNHKQDAKPFFLMLNHNNPHSPLDVLVDSIYANENWSNDEKSYASMVTKLDNSVGRIIQYLHNNNLDKNTIVIFTSDNGPRSEPTKRLTEVANFFKSKGAFRGYKRDVYEGGIREPFVVWSPKIIKGGTQTNAPAYFPDIMPTFEAISKSDKHFSTDGINLYPIILGKKQNNSRFLYWEFFEGGYVQAVRYGKWKAILKNNKFLLYNLENDLHEDHDIAAQNPDVVAKINAYLKKTARVESPYWPTPH